MPSPFPGMNPFLEQADAWHDFHERAIPFIAGALGPQVAPNYLVKVDEHVYVHELPDDDRRFIGRADAAIAKSSDATSSTTAGQTLAAPARGRLPAVDVERISYVEIRDRRNRQLVTVIELLSPSNKLPGGDREQYLVKRQELLASMVHVVEIDLLRCGQPMPVDDLADSDYRIIVSRYAERPQVDVWPVGLRDPLPTIPVPLRAGEAEPQLDLQDMLHRVYDAAMYQIYIYDGRPEPPLRSEDQVWAEKIVSGIA